MTEPQLLCSFNNPERRRCYCKVCDTWLACMLTSTAVLQIAQTHLVAAMTSSLGSANPAIVETFGPLLLEAAPAGGDGAPGSISSCSLGGAVASLLYGAISPADPVATDHALGVLAQVSSSAADVLLLHSSAALQALQRFNELEQMQAQRLCRVLGRIMAHEGAAADDVIDAEQHPLSATAQQAYNTALSSGHTPNVRCAIIAMLEWQLALAKASAAQAEQARNMLEALFGQVSRKPEQLAFLLQSLAAMLMQELRSVDRLAQVSA